MKVPVLLAVALSLGACSTVTIRDQGEAKIASKPDYSDRQSYWFWGLAGEHHIDVTQVCHEKEAKQMQAQSTFGDSLLSIITLGIYYPRTAKVWCD